MKTFAMLALSCAFVFEAVSVAEPNDGESWSPKSAAGYMDQRADWWMSWSMSARDHGTFCVSCHTVLPYALARPSLRADLGERRASATEQKLVDNITKRVRMWQDVEPFYTDEKSGVPKSLESRATESVLNALILTRLSPAGALSDDARIALNNMWAFQLSTGETKGALTWLNFHNEPWEADDSQYWGNTLVAVAAGSAPQSYLALPETQEHLKLLSAYLQKGQATQTLLNRLSLLWASTKVPGLLDPAQQQTIADDVMQVQQSDGGWMASSLVTKTWKRKDGTPFESKSDGFATGLVAFIFGEAKIAKTKEAGERAYVWLARNQNKEAGSWPAYSLNKERDLTSDRGRFMSDAATAYAVLALESRK